MSRLWDDLGTSEEKTAGGPQKSFYWSKNIGISIRLCGRGCDTRHFTKVRTVFKSDATDLGETCESLFPESYNPSNSVKNDSNQDKNASRPLLLFTLRVGAGAEIASNLSRDVVVLEIIWVDGQNKNDLYQLFQFLQNKILKGL